MSRKNFNCWHFKIYEQEIFFITLGSGSKLLANSSIFIFVTFGAKHTMFNTVPDGRIQHC